MDKFGRTRRIILIGTVMIAGGLASSVRADDSNTGSLNLAGIIIYKINQDGTLDGRWTHPDLKGMTGTERATGGTPGKLDGTYKVETHDEGNKEIFRGSLDIKPIGVSYSLTWIGDQVPPTGAQSKVIGVGLIESGNVLAASFQDGGPPSK